MSRITCRYCGRRIRWAHTTAGRPIPLDPAPDPTGSFAYINTVTGYRVKAMPADQLAERTAAERWTAHAATCPALRKGAT